MANRIEIKCVNKSDRLNPHERILNVGGVAANGDRWKISQQDAINHIDSGEWQFFVKRGLIGHEVNVIVAISQFGHKYIKTEADGEQPNNLLSLDSCPI